MINTINPATLPYVPFGNPAALPEISAVYFALSASEDVLYIGMTNNLRDRWQGRYLAREMRELRCNRIAWLSCSYEEAVHHERVMIRRFQPPLNGRVGRPFGKRSDPAYKQYSLLLKRQTHRQVEAIIRESENSPDMSELVQELLEDWLKRKV